MSTLQRSFNAHSPKRELGVEQARACVVERVTSHLRAVAASLRRNHVEISDIETALGPVLAAPVLADRDYPPFPRALRDGYAVRAADCGSAGASLHCVGQVAAGAASTGAIEPGACVEIMTGAAVPPGADAVVMVERTGRNSDRVTLAEAVQPGANIGAVGSDARRGAVIAASGRRLDAAAIAALASVGCLRPEVYMPPRVAIISTGDELVEAGRAPGPAQIRDANCPALAALARRAGAVPRLHACVPDSAAAIEAELERALAESDLVIFSGGASVGAHDLVAPVLAARGAEFYFDAVRMRPGRPVQFGRVADRLFFGLPGNPLGTMLSFMMYARPALELLSGLSPEALPPACLAARLGFDYRGKALNLTAFRPARLRPSGLDTEVDELLYHSSADLSAAAAADAFWLVPEGVTELAAGSPVQVLLK